MPFDGSGNYSRVHDWTSDRDNGIKIRADRMDQEFDDIAAALNQVFFRNGLVAMSGDLDLNGNALNGIASGTADAPSLQFSSDPNTGAYLAGAGVFAISSNGNKRFEVFTTGAKVTGTFNVTGATTLSSTLAVTGAATFASTIAVTGVATFNGGVNFGAAVTINNQRVLTVADEGSGNGLDADTLDGQHAASFAPVSHTHTIAQVSGLQSALNAKADASSLGNYLLTSGGTITGGLTINANAVVNGDLRVGDSNSDTSLTVRKGGSFGEMNDFASVIQTYADAGGGGGSQSGLYVQAGFSRNIDIVRFSAVGAGYVDTPRFLVRDTGRVAINTTGPSGYLTVNSAVQFDPLSANVTAGINIMNEGGTDGVGNYSTGITFSKINSTRPFGAIAGVQTNSDTDIGGLAFFVHASATSSDALVEVMRIAGDGVVSVDGLELGYRKVPRVDVGSGSSANASQVGKCLYVTGNVNIPAGVFNSGDCISIFNGTSSNITITQSGGVTLRLGGTTTTGNRTVAGFGMATIWFFNSTVCVVSGAGVS